jgi:uncharacterized protein YqjF (DUF2071 family)
MSVAVETIDRLSPSIRPPGRPAGYHRWHELLFLHWRISPVELAPHIPESLSIEMFEGSAWVGIVAFRMSGVRPWWSPAVPGISAFAETNVRTYVHHRGAHPGVWFLSLDAASSLGVQLGRRRWGLPYHRAEMRVQRRGPRIRYASERLWPGEMGVGGTLDFEVGDPIGGLDTGVRAGRAVSGTLEHFLVERYILYTQRGGRLHRGRVHHTPYPLREGRLIFANQTLLSALGLHQERAPDHVLYSEGVATEIFPLAPVD